MKGQDGGDSDHAKPIGSLAAMGQGDSRAAEQGNHLKEADRENFNLSTGSRYDLRRADHP